MFSGAAGAAISQPSCRLREHGRRCVPLSPEGLGQARCWALNVNTSLRMLLTDGEREGFTGSRLGGGGGEAGTSPLSSPGYPG